MGRDSEASAANDPARRSGEGGGGAGGPPSGRGQLVLEGTAERFGCGRPRVRLRVVVERRPERHDVRLEVRAHIVDGASVDPRDLVAWAATLRPRLVRFPRHREGAELEVWLDEVPGGWRDWLSDWRYAELDLLPDGKAHMIAWQE